LVHLHWLAKTTAPSRLLDVLEKHILSLFVRVFPSIFAIVTIKLGVIPKGLPEQVGSKA
jgi:hypothetical protein